ncbi:MAG: periplasmic heavy metal sensor [Lysobacteraceae bacterium]
MNPTANHRLGLLLLASVLLNLSLLVAGGLWWWGQRPSQAPTAPTSQAAQEDRERFRAQLAGDRERFRAHRRAVAGARATAADALRAEPFDPAALETAFAALRQAEGRAAVDTHEALLAFAGSLDAQGRERMAQRIERGRGGRGEGRGCRRRGD